MSVFTKILDVIAKSEYFSVIKDFVKDHKTIAIASSAIGLYGLYYLKRPRNLPPGPWGYPFIGSTLTFFDILNQLPQLRKKYGDVFCLWLGGNKYVVFLTSIGAMKEAYSSRGTEFLDRPQNIIQKLDGLTPEMFFANQTDRHIAIRKLLMQSLRKVVADRLDEIVKKNLDQFDDYLRDKDEIDPSDVILLLFTSFTLDVFFGQHLALDDAELGVNSKICTSGMTGIVYPYINDVFPFLLRPLFYLAASDHKEKMKGLVDLTSKLVTKRSKSMAEIKNFQCVADAFIGDKTVKMSADQLSSALAMVLPDSTSTSRDQALFMLLYLLHNEKYQDMIFEETQKLTGEWVGLNDKPNMPMTQAVVNEVTRSATLSEFGIFNRPRSSTSFRGYDIPKDVYVTAAFVCPHKDNDLFPDASSFKPERFIVDGRLTTPDALCPFGVGRRMCAGETLVKSELFLLAANLVKRYKMLPSKDGLGDLNKDFSTFIPSVKPFKMKFQRRT